MLINIQGAAGKFFAGLADYATWVPMSAEVKKNCATEINSCQFWCWRSFEVIAVHWNCKCYSFNLMSKLHHFNLTSKWTCKHLLIFLLCHWGTIYVLYVQSLRKTINWGSLYYAVILEAGGYIILLFRCSASKHLLSYSWWWCNSQRKVQTEIPQKLEPSRSRRI